jgi:hypothetical protein
MTTFLRPGGVTPAHTHAHHDGALTGFRAHSKYQCAVVLKTGASAAEQLVVTQRLCKADLNLCILEPDAGIHGDTLIILVQAPQVRPRDQRCSCSVTGVSHCGLLLRWCEREFLQLAACELRLLLANWTAASGQSEP